MAFRDPRRFVTQALGQSHEVYDLGRVWASGNGDADPSHPVSSDAQNRDISSATFHVILQTGGRCSERCNPSWPPLLASTVMVRPREAGGPPGGAVEA